MICGTGSYLPKEVLDNQYFVERFDTSDEWIVSRTGIHQRRRGAADEVTSTLAANAARKALADARVTIDDIDLIVVATATGDCMFPATASYTQALLGAKNIPAFDVGAACAGFLHAMIVAGGMLTAGLYSRALVIGAEMLTRWANPADRATAILFGDAAGAAVVSTSGSGEARVLYCELGCDGTRADLISAPAGGARMPASAVTVAEGLHYLHMRGREVYKFAVIKMLQLIENALEQSGLSADDVKLVIPHQSNLRIIASVREKFGLPEEKVAVNIDRYGNTSAASVIVALDEARRCGTVKEGDCVLLVAIGAGLSWGTMIIRL